MNATLRRSRALVVVVGLATLLAACGSSSKSSSPRTTSGGGGGSSVSATLNGAGSSFQKTFNEAVIAGVPRRELEDHRQLQPGRLGPGQERPPDQDRRLRRHRQPARSPRTSAPYQGGTVLNFPTVAAPITVSYNLPSVEQAAAERHHARQDLRAQDQEVERRGDRRRQPGRDAARRPRSPWRTAPTAPARRTTSRSSSPTSTRPTGRSAAATPSTGRRSARRRAATKNPGVAQIVKSTDGAIGYVDLADATAAGLQFASIKNKAGNVRRPDARRAPRPRSRARRSTPTCRTTRSTRRAPTRTRSPRRRGSSRTRSRRATTRAPRSRTFLQYIYGPGPDARADRRLRGAARIGRAEGRRAARASSRSRVVASRVIRRARTVATRASEEPARAAPERCWGDTSFRAVALGAGLSVLAILALIAYFTTKQAWPVFRHEGFGFVTGTTWDPTHNQFGALPFIYGTAVVVGDRARVRGSAQPRHRAVHQRARAAPPAQAGHLPRRPARRDPVGRVRPVGAGGARAAGEHRVPARRRHDRQAPGARPRLRRARRAARAS